MILNKVADIKLGNNSIKSVMLGGKKIFPSIPLPAGYREVKYLTASGKQYIDTNIVSSGVTIETVFRAPWSSGSLLAFLGSRRAWDSNSDNWSMFFSPNGNVRVDWLGMGTNINMSAPLNQDNTLIAYANGDVKINDVLRQTTASKIGSSLSIYLFNFNDGGSPRADGFVGSFKRTTFTSNDGTLIGDFVPCLDNTGRPCMYDLVTMNTFYNQGTGEFTYS